MLFTIWFAYVCKHHICKTCSPHVATTSRTPHYQMAARVGGGVNVTPPTTLHNLVDLVELTSPMTLVLKKSPPEINKMVNCTVRFQSGRTIRERTDTTTSCHDYVTLRYAYYA